MLINTPTHRSLGKTKNSFPQNIKKQKNQHLGFSKLVIVISAVLHQITLIYCQTLNG